MKEIISTELQGRLDEWRTEASFAIGRELSFWAHAYGVLVREHFKGELSQSIIQNLIDKTGEVVGRKLSRATIFLWVGLADINPDWNELIAPLEKHNIHIKGIYAHYKQPLLGKPEKELEKDDCRHCAKHGCPPPRESIGGGVIGTSPPIPSNSPDLPQGEE